MWLLPEGNITSAGVKQTRLEESLCRILKNFCFSLKKLLSSAAFSLKPSTQGLLKRAVNRQRRELVCLFVFFFKLSPFTSKSHPETIHTLVTKHEMNQLLVDSFAPSAKF